MSGLTALILALIIGIAMAIQSPTNANLGMSVGSMQASLVSFTGGFVVVAILCAVIGQGHISHFVNMPVWMWLGGLYGGYIVFAIATAAPRLGVALTLTMVMIGQLGGGIIVDYFGLFLSDKIPVSLLRFCGCVLVFAGIVLVYFGRRSGKNTASEEKLSATIPFMLMTFAAGLAGAVQAPTNAALGEAIGSIEASTISFGGGVIVLLVLTLIVNKGKLHSMKGVPLWKCTGGLYGAFGVFTTIVITPYLGVSLMVAGTMFGQLAGGMVVDSKGLLGMETIRVNASRIAGAIVLLVGVLMVSFSA